MVESKSVDFAAKLSILYPHSISNLWLKPSNYTFTAMLNLKKPASI